MDLQAIGTSKKCIFGPDKIEHGRRTSAAQLIADFGYMDVSDAGIVNSKDKELTKQLPAQQTVCWRSRTPCPGPLV
jgi:hypothetical protein